MKFDNRLKQLEMFVRNKSQQMNPAERQRYTELVRQKVWRLLQLMELGGLERFDELKANDEELLQIEEQLKSLNEMMKPYAYAYEGAREMLLQRLTRTAQATNQESSDEYK